MDGCEVKVLIVRIEQAARISNHRGQPEWIRVEVRSFIGLVFSLIDGYMYS